MNRITTRIGTMFAALLLMLAGAFILAASASAKPGDHKHLASFHWNGTGIVVDDGPTTQVYYGGVNSVDGASVSACLKLFTQEACTPQTLQDSVVIPVGTRDGTTFNLATSGCLAQWDVATQPLAPTLGKGQYTNGYVAGKVVQVSKCATTPPTSTPPSSTPPATPTPTPTTSTPVTIPPATHPSTPVTTHPVPSTTVSHPAPSTSTTKAVPVVPVPKHTTSAPHKRVAVPARTQRTVVAVTPVADQTGSLAYTGTSSNTKPLAVGGLLLLLVGGAIAFLARRKGAHQ